MYCWNCGGEALKKEASQMDYSDGYIVGECMDRDIEVADAVECYRCDDCDKISWITEETA